MSGRVVEHETPKLMSDERMAEIKGLIQAGKLYDEIVALETERDAARAEVARLQEQVEWLLEGRRQDEQRLALEIDI